MAEKCVLLHISKIIRRVCSSSHRPTVCRLLSIKADLTFISEAAANLQLRSRKGSEAGLTVRAPGSRTLTSGVDRPTLPAATRTRQPFSRGFNKLGSSGQIGKTLLDTAHYLTHGPSFVDTNNSALSPPFKGSHFLMAPCSIVKPAHTFQRDVDGLPCKLSLQPISILAEKNGLLGHSTSASLNCTNNYAVLAADRSSSNATNVFRHPAPLVSSYFFCSL